MLTKKGILLEIEKGNIQIEPFKPEQLNPNSYDLRLSPDVAVYEEVTLDAGRKNRISRSIIPASGLVLQPGELYLMSTQEYTSTSNYVPGIEGRSSVGRLGISVHATAGFGDVGFHGTWTLEVSVIKPVRVYAGMRICQIFFEECTGEVDVESDAYKGKYNKQVKPQPSQIWREVNEWEIKKEDNGSYN
jgi:dCTP deaminase